MNKVKKYQAFQYSYFFPLVSVVSYAIFETYISFFQNIIQIYFCHNIQINIEVYPNSTFPQLTFTETIKFSLEYLFLPIHMTFWFFPSSFLGQRSFHIFEA